jgi:hypothetical protein
MAKNNWSKSACTLIQRKRINNPAVWLDIFGITGPIFARDLNPSIQPDLFERGHHDWPVMRVFRPELSTSTERRRYVKVIAERWDVCRS